MCLGNGVSYGPTSSPSGGRRRWSFRSLAMTRELTAFKTSAEIGVCTAILSDHFRCSFRWIQTYLIVGHSIIRDELLNLRRGQHPADVADDLDIVRGSLMRRVRRILAVLARSLCLPS